MDALSRNPAFTELKFSGRERLGDQQFPCCIYWEEKVQLWKPLVGVGEMFKHRPKGRVGISQKKNVFPH